MREQDPVKPPAMFVCSSWYSISPILYPGWSSPIKATPRLTRALMRSHW